METIGLLISLLTAYERHGAEVIGGVRALIEALEELHVIKGESATVREIDKLFNVHGVNQQAVKTALTIGPVPEGPGLGANI